LPKFSSSSSSSWTSSSFLRMVYACLTSSFFLTSRVYFMTSLRVCNFSCSLKRFKLCLLTLRDTISCVHRFKLMFYSGSRRLRNRFHPHTVFSRVPQVFESLLIHPRKMNGFRSQERLLDAKFRLSSDDILVLLVSGKIRNPQSYVDSSYQLN
jgi:hypothetical protein